MVRSSGHSSFEIVVISCNKITRGRNLNGQVVRSLIFRDCDAYIIYKIIILLYSLAAAKSAAHLFETKS